MKKLIIFSMLFVLTFAATPFAQACDCEICDGTGWKKIKIWPFGTVARTLCICDINATPRAPWAHRH